MVIFNKNDETKYKYFDTPDGKDGFKKLIYTTTLATKVGIFAAVTDGMFYSKPNGFFPILGRFAYVLTPFVGMATAFTVTTYVATNARQKDDVINYLIGGIAAGIVYGKWRNSLRIGFNSCVACGIVAICYKYSRQNGIKLFGEGVVYHKVHNPDIWTYKRDYSVTSDPPRTWTT